MMIGQFGWEKIDSIRVLKHLTVMFYCIFSITHDEFSINAFFDHNL